MMTYINHLTLTTGHMARTYRSDVKPDVLSKISQWMDSAVLAGVTMPLPAPMQNYQALALLEDGGLIVTLYAQYRDGQASDLVPLLTFGVAVRSRHSAPLWAKLIQAHKPIPGLPNKPLHCPSTPWVAATLYPTIGLEPQVMRWAGDFERCCAWAWVDSTSTP